MFAPNSRAMFAQKSSKMA